MIIMLVKCTTEIQAKSHIHINRIASIKIRLHITCLVHCKIKMVTEMVDKDMLPLAQIVSQIKSLETRIRKSDNIYCQTVSVQKKADIQYPSFSLRHHLKQNTTISLIITYKIQLHQFSFFPQILGRYICLHKHNIFLNILL